MILYRKAPQLRVRRGDAPEPPFWYATALEPYSGRRTEPVAIDYLALRASAAERMEVGVCENVAGALERMRPLRSPVLIDATGGAEQVFRRGAAALAVCGARSLDTTYLLSTEGTIPADVPPGTLIAIGAWPPDPTRLRPLFGEAARRALHWGVFLPVVFPLTTELSLLDELSAIAAEAGASFFAASTIEAEAMARQAMAQSLALSAADDRYAMLFHSRLEPVGIATERHVAALAAERGMADSVPLPRPEDRSNWAAAAHLALAATRMLAMELDVDLAGLIARSARSAAALDKPVARIAESASLSIVGAFDETSAGMLTEWLETGRSSFAEWVAEEWRLRRGTMNDER